MSTQFPLVAIVGRTNVGKSTLFNALAARRIAIVEDTPGVTRDRHYKLISRYGFPFTLIDTGGLVGEEEAGFQNTVRLQAEVAISEADLILAVFDGLHGVHALDGEVVECLRRSGKPIIWIVNKCEKANPDSLAGEFYALGVEDIITVSAAHRGNIDALVERIRSGLGDKLMPVSENITPEADRPIRVAVVGKPNVGKSTFINKVIGQDRLVASEVAGTTTDSVDITVNRDGQSYLIMDTAGLRKKSRVENETIERYSNLRALKALAGADVAILMLDATLGPPSEQDAKIAGLVHERGRGLVIVVNKWDAVEKDHRTVKAFSESIYDVFKFARYAPIVYVSALTGRRCPAVLDTIKKVYQNGQLRLQTSELNKVLRRAFETKPPPPYHGAPIKFQFATQVSVAPPTLVLFVTHPRKIPFSYERYVRNCIRAEFPFEGYDIKFVLKKRTEKQSGAKDEESTWSR